jgi:hypothetical protein
MIVTAVNFPAGSIEYVVVTVTSDVTLGTQPVVLSLDKGVTWLPCTWVGDPGTTRKARTTDTVTFDPAMPATEVLVRVTDTPEVPIIRAGVLNVLG